jgi:RNA polymerase sigma-70 factor (ECF subfamily)
MKYEVEAIWKELRPQLKNFILSRVSDESAADDILQEVFIKIHSHIETLKDETKVERWIYQITRNTIIDHYRTQKIEEDIPQDIPVSDRTPEKIDLKTGFTSIKAIIESLPQPYAQALLLTEFEGLSQKELAQRLGISVSGAKSRVQRARKMLKTKLNQCCRIEFDSHGTIVDYQCSEYFLSWFKKIS